MNRMARCLVLCSFAVVLWVDNAVGEKFYFDMMHRYSPELRSEMERRNGNVGVDWPVEGSREYYKSLIHHDRDRHQSRNLLGSTGSVSFSPSNSTTEFLGGLHYSVVELGTPNVSFLVAVDTGSSLLWVPCQCKECAPTDGSYYGLPQLNFSVFDPSSSKTSKSITCSDAMCETALSANGCVNVTQNCNYIVSYVQQNTSTSGILIQDMLYLNSENLEGKTVTTPIYFGCGQEQTGPFSSGKAAPNGLLGLGLDKISIPSTLSRNGLASNSFSMCFSNSDRSGRLAFGEKGRSDLLNTSLLSLDIARTAYVVATTNAIVGDEVLELSANFIFDTGSSYTLMPQDSFKSLGTLLNKKINLPPFQDSQIFDYCWNISDSKDLDLLIPWTLVFSGGSNMSISKPYVALVNAEGNIEFACLGVMESTSVGIIAQNFMKGYEYFFDRDSASLSWSATNCSFPNGSLATSPEASLSGMSPQASIVPNVAPTSSITPPLIGETSTPPPGGDTNSSSRRAKSSICNVFVFLFCTIMIKFYV